MGATARYRDEVARTDTTGPVTFWGEWEADSEVVEVWPSAGELPRSLHRPLTGEPPVGRRENTDPWVFGEAFRYSNCKQLNGTIPTGLQNLPRGSLLLFGCTLGRRFVLDTVLVVAEATAQLLGQHLERESDPLFARNVWGSLTTDDKN